MRGASNRNTGRSVGWTQGRNEGWKPVINNNWKHIGEKKIITLFVDNLPDDSRSVWVHNLFSKFGRVKDLFIPRKTSRITGKRFGFVRFARKEEAMTAISRTNGLWIWGNTLTVKIARFEVHKGSLQKDQDMQFMKGSADKNRDNQVTRQYGVQFGENSRRIRNDWRAKKIEAKKVWRKKEGTNSKTNQVKPYLDALRRNSWAKPAQPIHLKELGNEWLYRSVIAKLSPVRSITLIQDQLRSLGYANIEVKIMGGDSVVLTFLTVEERDSMFNGGKMAWLKDWFLDSYKWELSTIKPLNRRLIWLNCYGIPIQLWNAHNFIKIGQYWGDVIQLSNETVKDLSFAVGKVLVSTLIMEGINEVIEVECKGCIYKIRVMEEQVVVNTFLKTDCSCQGCCCKVYHGEDEKERDTSNSVAKLKENEVMNREETKDNWDIVADSVGMANLVEVENVVEESGEAISTQSRVEDTFETNKMEVVGNLINVPSTNNCRQLVPINSALGTGSASLKNVHPQLVLCQQLESNLRDNRIQIQRALSNYNSNDDSTWSLASYNREIQKDNRRIVKEIVAEKPKRKQKSIEEILGIPKTGKSSRGGKKNKQKKAVVFRAAIAEAALSVSSGGINNRNRILLNEAEAVLAVTKILGEDYIGEDDEIISKIMLMEEEDDDRVSHLKNDLFIA